MTPHTIFVHCTATRPDWWAGKSTAEKVGEVRRWHLARGWRDIGYHYLIDRNGKVASGRPETQQGAHARGHNKDTLAVSLFGGHGSASTDDFHENFTAEQDAALRKLIRDLKRRHPTVSRIRGHNEVAAKACPGFTVAQWLTDAPPAPHAVEVPRNAGGLWAAIVAFLARVFGGKT